MKKVLYVATVDVHIKTFHLPYLKLLHDNGYEVHVATNGDEQFPYCDVKHQICIERSPFKFNNIKAIKQLKKIIDEEKFDIVHCHTPMGSVVARLAAMGASKKNGTRVIYTCHGFHFYKGAPKLNWILFYPIEKWLAKYTNTLITINKEDYNLAINKFKKRCHDIEYVPGVGIDTKKFQINLSEEEKNTLRESIGLEKNDYVLTCVARLDKNKNQGFLINVMEELVKESNNIHLLLVGPDELNGYYQNLVAEKKTKKNIHFLGRREDIPQILSISDVILSSSLREGLPVNVMEAFAAGKPVVALNCRGMNDLIENGENGFIVSNSNEMVEKILFLKKNKEYTNNISSNNKRKSINYSIDAIMNYMKKIYFKKKKVLHILSTNKYSGAENVACTIIKNMCDNYEMYYCSPKGDISIKLDEMGINYIPLNKLSFLEIKKVVKNINPDIIHAHDNKATVYSSFFKKKSTIISHIHGNNKIMNRRNLKTILFNLCSNNIDKFIWVSDSSLDGYYYKKNILNKSVVLYNVIDTKEVKNKSNAYKVEKKYDLIFLGRLAYPKNPERLIDIMKILKEKKNDITLAIVGDGSDRAKIEQLVRDFGLNDNITFYGYKQNPYPILKNSKILVMTSIYEGTPMCALEAQALGKYIIATPVDGLKKIVINDDNGFLSNDNEELANKIIEFLKKKQLNVNNIDSNLEKYLIAIDDIYNRKCSNEKSKCNNSDV
ncbi:glycosyltransferase [Kandleria vitulina]|uniref:glycosyltransferase n=1 Tax=Kandleria vitulina TaxID=1630 RepID=UPI0006891B89|nr:glycosyltransferase [Kandleria vitulina]